MDDRILSALDAIDPVQLLYTEWNNIGMALKQEGYPCSVWDAWSQRDPARYKAGESERKWKGFKGKSKPVTGGTIIYMARQQGWKPSFDGAMSWDSVIEYDGTTPTRRQENPAREIITYLRTLYEPGDFVKVVTTSYQDEKDGKWKPVGGAYDRTRDELIAALEQHPDDIGAALGELNTAAGAWIQFNPVDGKGAKAENVTRFKYALVESDDLPIDEQYNKYRELNLPIACLVHSGGKSLHAIVRVDAENPEEYAENVQYLYTCCQEHGLTIDRQNSNPNRLSRLPGVQRGEGRQRLLATNIGCRSWREWKNSIESQDGLPDFVNLGDLDLKNPPEPPEVLIEGILRCGHKMLISGSSKAGKSYLLMQLAIAIAEGTKWLGFQCKQGKVLYVNLEIDGNSAEHRFADIYNALNLPGECRKNLTIWNLRGHAIPLNQLVPKLNSRCQDEHYIAVIIDPIYKVITGDENNASEMGKFCNQFDKICNATGAAAIYCHHHSKGAQGAKRAMDRASGSGVFARDPDAQLDIIELVLTNEVRELIQDGKATAWRMESSLREFPNIKPVDFWFNWPIHVLDIKGDLKNCPTEGSRDGNLEKSGKRQMSKEESRRALDREYDKMKEFFADDRPIKLAALAVAVGRSERCVRDWIRLDKEFSDYKYEKGVVWRVDDDTETDGNRENS